MFQINIQRIANIRQPAAACPQAVPEDWTEAAALALAECEDLALSQDHWEAIYILREYYQDRSTFLDAQEALGCLEEEFGGRGSRKYLSQLFPGGVIAQGCRIAGLPVISRAMERASESVH